MYGIVHIPTISDATDGKSPYTVFNVHLNGAYHSSLRYSQLLSFHQELKANFDCSQLGEFPGKSLLGLALTDQQMENRKTQLEYYLHSCFQDKVIGCSELLKEFFCAAQKASNEYTDEKLDLEVYLINGKKVTLKVPASDRTDQVLEQAGSEIGLNTDFTYYFGLYLEKEEASPGSSSWKLERPLTDFECPYLSLATVNKHFPHRITIRTNFWDPKVVPSLLGDRVAKNLLYIEALSSVALEHWDVPNTKLDNLSAMQKKALKKEYLDIASSLAQFGYRQLDDVEFDHPKEGMKGSVRVGKMEVVTYSVNSAEGLGLKKCRQYALTRMRSWKVGYTQGVPCVKFHYQEGKDSFVWVTITGEKAVFLALCLHSAVNELLRVRAKKPIRTPKDHPINRQMRDLPRVMFLDPPVTLIPRPLSQRQFQPSSEDNTDGDEPEDDVVFHPSASSFGSSQSAPTSSEGKGSMSSQQRTESAGSDSLDQQSEVTDNGLHTGRLSSVGSAVSTQSSASRKSTTSTSLAPAAKKGRSKKGGEADVQNPTFDYGDDDDL